MHYIALFQENNSRKYLLFEYKSSCQGQKNLHCLNSQPSFNIRHVNLHRNSYRQCNSVETAEPGDRTTNPGIVMPECYASSQRVDSLARVVITPVRHTHTRLHTPLSNICSSPSSIQHTRGLNSSYSCIPHACFTATRYWVQT